MKKTKFDKLDFSLLPEAFLNERSDFSLITTLDGEGFLADDGILISPLHEISVNSLKEELYKRRYQREVDEDYEKSFFVFKADYEVDSINGRLNLLVDYRLLPTNHTRYFNFWVEEYFEISNFRYISINGQQYNITKDSLFTTTYPQGNYRIQVSKDGVKFLIPLTKDIYYPCSNIPFSFLKAMPEDTFPAITLDTNNELNPKGGTGKNNFQFYGDLSYTPVLKTVGIKKSIQDSTDSDLEYLARINNTLNTKVIDGVNYTIFNRTYEKNTKEATNINWVKIK